MNDRMAPAQTAEEMLEQAQQALVGGDLAKVRRLAGAVLAATPRHPQALYLTGVAAALSDDPATAADLLQASVAAGGDAPEAYYNLGQALHRLGDASGAERAYWSALLRAPGFADAYSGLGVSLAGMGRMSDAVAALRRAVAERPGDAQMLENLASALVAAGRPVETYHLYRDWLTREPGNRRLVFLTGTAALHADMLEEAERLLRQHLLHKPRDAGTFNNLGLALARMGRVSEAIAVLSKAVDIQPDYGAAWFALASAYQAAGDFAASADAYAKVRELVGEDLGADSNILMALNYSDTLSAAEVFNRHQRWGEDYQARVDEKRQAEHETPRIEPQPLTGRRLRIGYVSPDFRLHSVSMFLLPLLENHDRARVELFAYSNVERHDFVTETVIQQVDGWRSIVGKSAEEAAALIRGDRIDVLIDLAGHTARHRLDAFALRPAPIQATWLGYPATTGLPAVDARFTDVAADPPGESDRLHVERLIRLERFLCYRPLGPTPDPLSAPVLSRGAISFGSFNALSKLNAATAALWSRAMLAVPGSRLVLKTSLLADPGVKARVLALFASHGIEAGRIVMLPHIPHHFGHLDTYGEIDIALDPTPYNGTTTTCEALWMGVPTLTLPGDRHAARVGASLLTAAGMEEWIAADADDFVAKAAALAADPQRLAELRLSIRRRMAASPLCDAARFAKNFEDACYALRRPAQ